MATVAFRTLLQKTKNAREGKCIPPIDIDKFTNPRFKEKWEHSAITERLKLTQQGFSGRISFLLKDIEINGSRGNPEILTGSYSEWMSRRISKKHRLIYKVETVDNQQIIIVKECGGHYKG